MLDETKLMEHAEVSLALLLLLLGSCCRLGTLERILPFPVMLVDGAKRREIAALRVLVTNEHQQGADVADGCQAVFSGELLDVLGRWPILALAIPEDELLLTHLGELAPIDNPRVGVFFLGRRIINRNLTDIDGEAGLQCRTAILEDVDRARRPFVAWFQGVGIRYECHLASQLEELLQLVRRPCASKTRHGVEDADALQLNHIGTALHQVELVLQTCLLLCEVDAEDRGVLVIYEAVLQIEVLADVLVVGHGASRESYDTAHFVIDRYGISVTEHGILATLTLADKANRLQVVEVESFGLRPSEESLLRRISYAECLDGILTPACLDRLFRLLRPGIALPYAVLEIRLSVREDDAQRIRLFLLLNFLIAWLVIILYVLIEVFLGKVAACNREW